MTTAIDRLKIQGGPAPRNGVLSSTMAKVTFKANKLIPSNIKELETNYQFILKQDKTSDLMLKGINHLSVQTRKSMHLTRVQKANLGISSMDSLHNVSKDSDVVIDKPHFVLCGLPIGTKTVDPQLYLHEARVGNYKTSARELNKVKRANKSGKAYSEPTPPSRDNEVNGSGPFSLALDDLDSMPILSTPPVIPPLTPANSAITNKRVGGESTKSYLDIKCSKDVINSAANAWDVFPSQAFVLFSHKKEPSPMEYANHQNDETKDFFDAKPPRSDVNSRSMVDGITKQIFDQQKRPKYAKPFVRGGIKQNFNNPYRNFKHKERLALTNNDRYEFTSIEGYMSFNKQIKQKYGRDTIVPRSIIRVPNPCSDTFLLQMMYELNRPKSRRSVGESSTSKQSDIAAHKDLEDLVHSTASSLKKTNSSIDMFQSHYKSTI